jgi:hypothetical protein
VSGVLCPGLLEAPDCAAIDAAETLSSLRQPCFAGFGSGALRGMRLVPGHC